MDRNVSGKNLVRRLPESLSARRAWIEILIIRQHREPDRSLSARRAWIEIQALSLSTL